MVDVKQTSPSSSRSPVPGTIKTILAAPVTAGIVLLIGFGLVRAAHWKQSRSGKPDPVPAVAASDGSLTLQLPFAEIRGEMTYGGRGERRALRHWTQTDDSVAWRFPIEKKGSYRVELDYSCPEQEAGSKVAIDFAGKVLEHTVKPTAPEPPRKDGKDWPRDDRNQFEKQLVEGTVTIDQPGHYELHVTPVSVLNGSVMRLRSVRLIPH